MDKYKKAYMRLWAKKHRNDRISKGLCAYCGKPNDRIDMDVYSCSACAEKINAYCRMNHVRRIEHGLCARCCKPNDREGKVYCSACAAKYSEEGKRLREQLKLRQICTRCHKGDAVPGRTLCQECLEKQRAYNRERYHRLKEAGEKA